MRRPRLPLAAIAMTLSLAAACARTGAQREPAVATDPFQRTFQTKEEAVEAMKAKSSDAPKAGDLAPDFTLASPDGSEPVRLSSFRGIAPVVLVFGSYT